MGTTPVYGWRTPDGGVGANGPDALMTLATDIETTLTSGGWTGYTPSWTGGVQNPANPASKVGRYRLANGWCDFEIYIGFGGSVYGGKGPLYIGLPATASVAINEQLSLCKLWVPAVGNIEGFGLIRAGSSVVEPIFPVNLSSAIMATWRNNDDAGNPGTGIPQIPGHWTAEANGNIGVSGRYLVTS